MLPGPLLTRDQVESLKTDNIVAEDALTLADLGVRAKDPDDILPLYLERYCPGGHYAEGRPA
jgi:NADH dehydrogenase